MYKLWKSTYKELLLLSRDFGGLLVLFIMPLALIITITLIQDSSFKQLNNAKIPILLVDLDQGNVAQEIIKNFEAAKSYQLLTELEGQILTESTAKNAVLSGDYQMAIVIPPQLSSDLEKKVTQNVNQILSEFGLEEENSVFETVEAKQIKLYFDPALQLAFKNGVMSGIDQMIAKLESKYIYEAFQEELATDDEQANPLLSEGNFVSFVEIDPLEGKREAIPNSTQHNVPAWTLFAIFFIVIPLSINMVKEKNQGTFVRLRTNPVSYLTVLGGKTITYVLVSFVQFLLMLAVGVYVLPLFGLPGLAIGSNFMVLCLVAIFAGFAAVGFGLLLGTLASTPEQSAPFGATAVVIMAAIGGVWVPVFMMPKLMQTLSNISPMNWGLEAFYDVFLRQAGIVEVLPEIGLLFLFFLITLTLAVVFDKKRSLV
ncbi:ABC transporter permease [Flavobacteriaceae bacterium F08102]|nr:ABC transporter permease [Flavobacteriaceae bacterium F08102]